MSDPASRRFRVLVVDDHPVSRLGLVAIFEASPQLIVVEQAATVAEAVERFERVRPDVAVLDMRLPDGTGLDAVAGFQRVEPQPKVLIITGVEAEELAYQALRLGVSGYVSKSTPPAALVRAVCEVAMGRTAIADEIRALVSGREQHDDLTAREVEVLRLIVEGRSNAEIGIALDISEGTARRHVSNILPKLGVADRTGAAAAALRRGIV